MNLKRILLLIAFLVIVVLIGWGIYAMFKKAGQVAPPVANLPTQPGQPGTLPTAGTRSTTAGGGGGEQTILPSANFTPQQPAPNYYKPEGVTQVSADFATYPSLNSNGGFRYYNAGDGKFYKVDQGKVTPMSQQVFYNASKVTWAKNRDEAVIEYPDSTKIIYNFAEGKQVSLPKHWEDFSFSPEGKEIAAKAMGLAPENRWLVTANDDGSGTKTIEPMGDNADKVTVDWSPSRQTVAFSQTGQALGADRTEILMVGLNQENFKSLVVEGDNFEPNWSPTGKRLLYSVHSARSDYKPELWISDAYGDSIGNNRQTLQLNTWADKCSFSDDNTLYCAVPRDLPQGADMGREVASGLSDDLYKIDLKTGLKTSIPLNGDYNITNISFDGTGSKLYFTDLNKSGVFATKL